MSTERKLDPRVKRTRRLIEEALFSLLGEQDAATITVAEIARRAEINRNTFYLHYRDKEELLTQALNDLFEELTAASRRASESHSVPHADEVPTTLVALFEAFGRRPALYRQLIGEAGATPFAQRLRAFHERQFMRLWAELRHLAEPGSPPPEMRARCVATMVEGAVGWWLEMGQPITPREAADMTWQLLRPIWFERVELESTNHSK